MAWERKVVLVREKTELYIIYIRESEFEDLSDFYKDGFEITLQIVNYYIKNLVYIFICVRDKVAEIVKFPFYFYRLKI